MPPGTLAADKADVGSQWSEPVMKGNLLHLLFLPGHFFPFLIDFYPSGVGEPPALKSLSNASVITALLHLSYDHS